MSLKSLMPSKPQAFKPSNAFKAPEVLKPFNAHDDNELKLNLRDEWVFNMENIFCLWLVIFRLEYLLMAVITQR